MLGNEFIEDLFTLFRIKESEDALKYIKLYKAQRIEVIGIDRVLQLFNEIENITENKFTIYYKNTEGKEVAEVAVSMITINIVDLLMMKEFIERLKILIIKLNMR